MQATIIHYEFLKSHLAPTLQVRQKAFLNSLLGLLEFATFKPKCNFNLLLCPKRRQGTDVIEIGLRILSILKDCIWPYETTARGMTCGAHTRKSTVK